MRSASFRIPASLIVLLGLIIVSCSKDKATNKPQLSIKSITTLVPYNGQLDVVLEFTSKTGDLGGGNFIAIRTRLNQDIIPLGFGNNDTFTTAIPSFPNASKGEFEFKPQFQTLYESYGSDSAELTEPDTIVFKFAAMDADSVFSDTITSPKIVVLGQ